MPTHNREVGHGGLTGIVHDEKLAVRATPHLGHDRFDAAFEIVGTGVMSADDDRDHQYPASRIHSAIARHDPSRSTGGDHAASTRVSKRRSAPMTVRNTGSPPANGDRRPSRPGPPRRRSGKAYTPP